MIILAILATETPNDNLFWLITNNTFVPLWHDEACFNVS